MKAIEHQAISASAGSGKTFQLAHRYIRLLASGVEPDRIIALTFSRKAAGEIFDYIMGYLRDAAASDAKAAETAANIGVKKYGRADFLRLLRVVTDRLHRTHISTLDSFIVGVIGTFPMELGIGTSLRILDTADTALGEVNREVIARVLSHRAVDAPSRKAFFESLRQAAYGEEEKTLENLLEPLIGTYRGCYRTAPDGAIWGEASAIWGKEPEWLEPVKDVGKTAARMQALLAKSGAPDKTLDRWSEFLDEVRGYGAGSPWTQPLAYLFGKLTDALPELRTGKATIPIERAKQVLEGDACGLALELVRHVVFTDLDRALQRTKGIYRFLAAYEELYDQMARGQGRLTFADAQYLLTEANRRSGRSVLSRQKDEESRLYIDYRLDCRLDHWLIDEFQDTSDLQWEVLRNLADEILQDNSGERTFFYVGDVKQAIYGWRGGNPRLFGQIVRKYPNIRRLPLSKSFRSCRPIIEAVNEVFEKPGGGIPDATARKWKEVWEKHDCADGKVPESGYFALLEPPMPDEGKPEAEDRYRVVAEILQEIRPLDCGMSVGILVRTNDTGSALVDYLRQTCPGMTVVHEGKAAIEDNPVVAVLLALAKFAAHPGDTLAWRHLEMSPLSAGFREDGLDRGRLPLVLLRQIEEEGFQSFLRRWGRRLNAAHPLDAFGRKRLAELLVAAGEFDEGGSRDVAGFLRFVDGYEKHELAAENAVRVMTVHQSKGLGFDLVIAPDLMHRDITAADLDLAVARDPKTDAPKWVLKMPRQQIAERDTVLAEEVQRLSAEGCFEELCVLYVMLTRAREGLYVVTSYPGPNSRSLTLAAFVKQQLLGDAKPTGGKTVKIGGGTFTRLYDKGDKDWYKRRQAEEPRRAAPAAREVPAKFRERPSLRRSLSRVQPSARHETEQEAWKLFDAGQREAMDFGTAVHSLFEQVEWSDGLDAEKTVREWEKTAAVPEAVKREVGAQFREAMKSEEVRRALAKPAGRVELWREKRFEIVLGDDWISGAFDRVVIQRDAAGRPASATVLDYKSDQVGSEEDVVAKAAGYAPQLIEYRRSLSRILKLDEAKIALRLVFTRAGRVVSV